MRTRSIFAEEILELQQRAERRAKRKSREIRSLIEAAGKDAPNSATFEDNTPRRTRRQSTSQNSTISKVAVSQASSRELHSQESDLQTTKSQVSKRSFDVVIEAKYRDLALKKVSTDLQATGEIAKTDKLKELYNSKQNCKLSYQSVPSRHTLKTRRYPTSKVHNVRLVKKIKQLRAIQTAISQETWNRTNKGNKQIIQGLKRALKKLKVAQKIRSDKSEACIPGQPSPWLNPPIVKKPFLASDKSVEKEKALVVAPEEVILLVTEQGPEGAEQDSQNPEQLLPASNSEPTMDHTDVDTERKDFPLLDDCLHYTRKQDVDWDIQKYYDQRYSIWSRYDEGIYMTDDSWFGVTPEPVANKVAEDLSNVAAPSKKVLIDMFAGAGGNVIAFALSNRWSKIIAIEKNPSVIACAQHNATIYGVSEQIIWINDDSFSYLESNASCINPSETVIFASPPWGGPGYSTDEIFNLSTMVPYGIQQIHDACKGMQSALYLPRSSDLRQLAKLAPQGQKIEVVQYCMMGAGKAMVAYIPAAISHGSA